MQIAPTAPMPRAASVTITARDFVAHPDAVAKQLASLDDSAASKLMRTNGSDFMSLQGVASVHSDREHPDEIRITFANDSFLRLADNVLRDTVNGVKLVFESQLAVPPSDADWWTGSTNQMAATVRGMQGVIDSSAISEHGEYDLMFRTTGADVSARLKSIINDTFGRYNVRWIPFA